MDDTVELIVAETLKRTERFGYADQSWILNEVADKLREEADNALKMEYFGTNIIDE